MWMTDIIDVTLQVITHSSATPYILGAWVFGAVWTIAGNIITGRYRRKVDL